MSRHEYEPQANFTDSIVRYYFIKKKRNILKDYNINREVIQGLV